METRQVETLKQIGGRIRSERKRLGLSLEALAGKAGISKMTLHRIETGATSPSIVTLAEISFHLKKPLEALIRQGQAKVVLIRHDQQDTIFDPRHGIRVVAPAGLISERIVLTYAEVEAGTIFETHTNHGFEWALLIQGRASVAVGDKEYLIQAGDSIFFDAHFPHSMVIEEKVKYINLFLKDA